MAKLDIGVGEDFPLEEKSGGEDCRETSRGQRQRHRHHDHHHHHGFWHDYFHARFSRGRGRGDDKQDRE